MANAIDIIESNDEHIIKRLMEIEKQAFGNAGLDEWNLIPYMRHGRVMALRDDEQIIGGAQFIKDWNDPLCAYLVGIAVDASYRGKGLGTFFLAECLSILKKEGIKSVELTVDPGNTGAIKVYETKLGFVTTQTRIGEYGAGEDRLVMRVML